MTTIYVSIGNSDDKLGQWDWAKYIVSVNLAISRIADRVHGSWYSAPDSRWQNACWCFEVADVDGVSHRLGALKGTLSTVREEFDQDSIAWAEVAETEMI